MTEAARPVAAAAAVRRWLGDLREAERFTLEPMALARSETWALRDGAIRHRSGRFFSVIGVEHGGPSGAARAAQPLLDQREIGTLALVAARVEGEARLLVQAKAEPGNVGLFQLAPTLQATASNAARVHGGAAPRFLGLIEGREAAPLLADTLQSEQGTRFLGKRNRNCTILGDARLPDGGHHRWLAARDLLGWVGEDHLLNTDLRSTLVCSDWDFLAGGDPFPGDGVAACLRRSWLASDEEGSFDRIDRIEARLDARASGLGEPRGVPLEALPGWALGEEGPYPLCGVPYRVRHIRVRSASREVESWDQPIIASAGAGLVVLPMAFWGDIAHFLFRASVEPGFGRRVELTPAWTTEPGGPRGAGEWAEAIERGQVVARCRQSDEGGRFLFDESEYAVVRLERWRPPQDGEHWLTLRQSKRLVDRGGRVTNEARSALSLLLRWL